MTMRMWDGGSSCQERIAEGVQVFGFIVVREREGWTELAFLEFLHIGG
jgi:hypothetical protein